MIWTSRGVLGHLENVLSVGCDCQRHDGLWHTDAGHGELGAARERVAGGAVEAKHGADLAGLQAARKQCVC